MLPLSKSAAKVQAALMDSGLSLEVIELPDSTRTSAEAAQTIGCQVGQIAKSIVFRAIPSERPILVIASGSNRVNEGIVARLTGEKIEKANADFVQQQTGFVIGGVPPIGHNVPLATYIDQDLMQYSQIWAAAGTPHAVFRLTPADLVRITGGMVLKITG
jgi:prolyl-tRNA editing enzyme YbaK/EbsC (Cys-tRNA(Pro) deacylase)